MSPLLRLPTHRVAWLVVGIVLAAFAVYEVVVHDLDPLLLVAFVVAPDLAFLVGAGQPHALDQLPRRAVPWYNVAHQPVLPLVVIALALVALLAARLLNDDPARWEAARALPLVAYTAGITWLAHIALDRAFGFGLRTPDGWQRPDRRAASGTIDRGGTHEH
jgi:hypothetical protein